LFERGPAACAAESRSAGAVLGKGDTGRVGSAGRPARSRARTTRTPARGTGSDGELQQGSPCTSGLDLPGVGQSRPGASAAGAGAQDSAAGTDGSHAGAGAACASPGLEQARTLGGGGERPAGSADALPRDGCALCRSKNSLYCRVGVTQERGVGTSSPAV